jgi:hypothetical protein
MAVHRFGAIIGLLAVFGLAFAARAAEREVDLQLVLAADVSGSMDLEEATLQRRGFANALRHPEILEAIRRGPLGRIAVTYVEWAGDQLQSTLVDWTEISDSASAEAFAAAVEQPPVRTALWTSISGAIFFGLRRFAESEYRSDRRVLDISGDGPNNKGLPVDTARDHAVAEGITINGLPIVNDRPSRFGLPPLPNLDLYYEDCVIGGFGSFVVVADGFRDFARAILRKMLLEIAGTPPKAPLLHLADGRPRPPCIAGELQLQRFNYDDY